MRALDVFLHSDRVGRLERLPGGHFAFAYEPSWVEAGGAPVSLSLPLREAPFGDRECRPFFAGLLPEGDFLKAIARAFHVSADNSFDVLAEIGGECAGAISLVAEGADPPSVAAPEPEWLTEQGLARLLAELPSRPLLVGAGDDDDGVRLSLAGARDKLPLLIENARVGITRGHPPSTHIVKTPILSVPEMVANEAYCMALAQAIGLGAAMATPIGQEQEGLLVERYDRFRSGESVRRLHQEDLCQAAGVDSADKYEAAGGPGVALCAKLIRRHAAGPGADLLRFLDALLFNLLIGNADAHAKNYSLLLEGPGAPRLAPLYDLLSTRVYGRRFGRKMAMKYGGEYRPDRVRGRHLDRLGEDLGIASKRVRLHAREIADRATSSGETARAALPAAWQGAAIIDAIDQNISEFAESLRRAAAEPG